jgi:rhodanese-related sulfurtransferase
MRIKRRNCMRRKPWGKIAVVMGIMLLLISMPLLGACGGGEEGEATPTPTPTPTTATSEFDVVKDAVAAYLADRAGNINAGDLNDLIAADEAPYIISLRSAADYAKGHIPGAVNIAFGDLFKAATLATLPDEEIVVYCYTGQSGSMAAALLGTLGYDVQNLRNGMCSWTTDPTVAVSCFDPAADQNDFAVETTANVATETYEYPVLDNTASTDEDEILRAAAAAVSPKYITAGDLNDMIAEGDAPFILSIRSADDYANGHIPGAVNIGLDSLADNLNKLPPDETIVVYCYTGHTAGQATALLNMLGYDAESLKFGMCSWSSDEAVNAGICFNRALDASDFTVETGS